jgi:two-component system NtrC family sensor kinase
MLSSHSALVFTMGVSAYLGALHLWFARRGEREHAWVALWAILAVLFQAGRLLHIESQDPATAVRLARLSVGLSPLMIAALISFARNLAGIPTSRGVALSFWGTSVGAAAAIAFTPYMFPEAHGFRVDPFGQAYIGVPGSPWLGVLGIYLLVVLGWLTHTLGRAPSLAAGERRGLVASLGAYALLGLTSVVSALGWIPVPVVAEYGPFLMATALSYMLVSRLRRLEGELQALVEARTNELQASEARSLSLIENAPVGVFACESDGCITTVNPRLAELLGASSPREIQSRNALAFPPLREAGISAAIGDCLRDGVCSVQEHRYRSSYGRLLDVRLTLAPLRNAAGEVHGALGLVEDVTERRALEQQLLRSQKMESVGQLAAGIAHEINNPMAYVHANLGVLVKEWRDLRASSELDTALLGDRLAECEELLAETQEGVDRTISIVRDVREIAHTGGQSRGSTELNPLLETCLRVASTHRKDGVRIDEVYGDLPTLWASASQLQQLFLNLVVNALQAVDAGGLVRVTTAAEGIWVVVRIEDDGPGILEGAEDKLFDPFFTTKEAGEGTGLGLYMSYQIVQAHGGEILAASHPGRGTTFTVRLPAAPHAGAEL